MKKAKSILLLLSLMLFTVTTILPFHADAEENRNIRLIINGKTLTAILDNTPAGRDFYAMLPLSLTLEDFHDTEKISDLPRSLSLEDAPEGFTPSAGTLAYYAPWGNLAIFYKDFSWSRGLIPLGRITSSMTEIAAAKNGTVITIEQID